MVDSVFQPTRDEPVFEDAFNPIDGMDVSIFRFTTRWSTYLDGLGTGVNGTDEGVDDAVAGLESEIKKVSAAQGEIQKSLNELFELVSDTSNTRALLIQLTKKVTDLEQLINDS